MQKLSEVIQEFEILGWILSKDSIGDKFITYSFSDTEQVSACLVLKQIRGDSKLSGLFCVSTERFSRIYTKLQNKRKIDTIGIAKKEFRWLLADSNKNQIAPIAEQVIQWARSVNVNNEINKFVLLPTDAVGNQPLLHLAALAITNNYTRLNNYLESFKQGNRLGFVPYITQAHIERALKCIESNHI